MFREITTKIARSGPTAHLRPGAEASGDRDSIVTGDTLEGGGALTASERLGAGLRGRRRRATPSPRAVLPLASSSPRRVLLGLGQRSREQRAGRPLLDADGLLGPQAHVVLRDQVALEAHAPGGGGHVRLGALGAEPACDRPHGLGQVAEAVPGAPRARRALVLVPGDHGADRGAEGAVVLRDEVVVGAHDGGEALLSRRALARGRVRSEEHT